MEKYQINMFKLQNATVELSRVLDKHYGGNLIDGVVACIVMAIYGGRKISKDLASEDGKSYEDAIKNNIHALIDNLWPGIRWEDDGGLVMPENISLVSPADMPS